MIYLIKVVYYDEENNKPLPVLKIGYSDEIEKRFLSHLSSNPRAELIDVIDGSLEDESKIHQYFNNYKLPNSQEWFYYDPKIIKKFGSILKGDVLNEETLKDVLTHLIFPKYLREMILFKMKSKFGKEIVKKYNDRINYWIRVGVLNQLTKYVNSLDFSSIQNNLDKESIIIFHSPIINEELEISVGQLFGFDKSANVSNTYSISSKNSTIDMISGICNSFKQQSTLLIKQYSNNLEKLDIYTKDDDMFYIKPDGSFNQEKFDVEMGVYEITRNLFSERLNYLLL